MLVMIDGPMISQFIDDKSFRKFTDDRFAELDADRDGLLLRDDLRWEFSQSMALDHHQPQNSKENDDNLVFEKFDLNKDGSIDKEEFRSMMTEILTAIARGIGTMPIIVGIGVDSLLMKAYENELARIERKLAEIADLKLRDEASELELIRKDLRKKKSRKIFGIGIGMCACSPKYLGDD